MKSPNQVFKIACTPPDHDMGDDVGAILESMGLRYEEFKIQNLEDQKLMQMIDLLFINCPGPEPTWTSANNVREFVDRGGALYISCYARKWIDFIFPGLIEFHGEGEIQKELLAKVVDRQLRDFLGGIDQLYLRYNTHWHGIKKIKDKSERVQEYLRGVRAGWFEEEALLLSFPYGEGFVIFTTFHNSQQVNALEHRLLEYLVLKPLLANVSAQSKTIMQRKNYRPMKEFLGALSVGEVSKEHEFYNKDYSNLKIVFNWEGKATTRVWVINPSNNVVLEKNIRDSPFEHTVAAAKPGVWRVKMQIVDAPLKKFPFIIQVGKKSAVDRQIELNDRTVVQHYSKPKSKFRQSEIEHYKPKSEIKNIPEIQFSSPFSENGQESENLEIEFSNTSHISQDPLKLKHKEINLFSKPVKGTPEEPNEEKCLGDCVHSPSFNQMTGLCVNIELLEPARKKLGSFDLTFGKEIFIGMDFFNDFIGDLAELDVNVPKLMFSIKLINECEMVVKQLSDYGLLGQSYESGEYDLHPLIPEIGVALNLPVVLKLGKDSKFLMGLYL